MAVDASGAYANLSVAGLADSLSSVDQALLVQLVYGTVSMRLAIDYQLDRLLRHPLTSLPIAVKNILRLGAYQLMYLDRIPARAAVDESVKLTHRFGHEGTARLVNAVLRRLSQVSPLSWPDRAEDPVHYLAVRYSHPSFLVTRYLNRLGWEETEQLLAINNLPPRFCIRVNTTRISTEQLRLRLMERGMVVTPGQYVPEVLYPHPTPSFADELFADGLYIVQGEASAMVAHLLAPKPHDRVVDLCAAPGGKSTHLAALMGDRGEVLAFDRNAARLKLVEDNASRLGLKTIRTYHKSAQEALAMTGEVDKVLLDAPCSGFGVLRHKADLRWRHTEADLAQLARRQRELILTAAELVAPGGTLVYSVCTTEPEETTVIVKTMLSARSDFAVAEPTTFERSLPRSDGPGHFLWPHRHEIDGFYIVALRRQS